MEPTSMVDVWDILPFEIDISTRIKFSGVRLVVRSHDFNHTATEAPRPDQNIKD
jgi:hypothetical protein